MYTSTGHALRSTYTLECEQKIALKLCQMFYRPKDIIYSEWLTSGFISPGGISFFRHFFCRIVVIA